MKEVKNNGGSVEYECEWCGEHFLAPPSRGRAKHICCSKKCQSELRKSWHLNCVCPICGKRFHVKPSQVNGHNCCSKDCLSKYKSVHFCGENNHQFGLKGKDNPTWKSDTRISYYGYRLVRVLDHPFRNANDMVFEHRLVAEKYLLTEENSVEVNGKRYLSDKYHVHHKDQNRLNNDPSNLEVMLKGDHIRLHNKLNPHKRDKETGRFLPTKENK